MTTTSQWHKTLRTYFPLAGHWVSGLTLFHVPHSWAQVGGNEYLGQVFTKVRGERQVETCLATERLGSELIHSLLPTHHWSKQVHGQAQYQWCMEVTHWWMFSEENECWLWNNLLYYTTWLEGIYLKPKTQFSFLEIVSCLCHGATMRTPWDRIWKSLSILPDE